MISNIERLEKKIPYNLGIVGFFFLVTIVTISLYLATAKIDYIWRWKRVTSYFAYMDKIEIKSEVQGIAEIGSDTKEVYVIVAGKKNKEKHLIPKKATLLIDSGDFIYQGDTLASYEKLKSGVLLQGLGVTLKSSAIATVFGILIGLICGIARLAKNPFLRWSSIVYVEIIRGSPLLVQIFIWYFVFGSILNAVFASYGFAQIEPIWYGIAALAFFTGAYVGEIVRAGIQSINRGQTEAARSLGMTSAQCMRYVVLPQALKRIIPPLAGQFINLIKDSCLLGIIAVRELTKATREVITTSLQPFELWFMCAIMYLVLTFTLSMFLQYIEKRAPAK